MLKITLAKSANYLLMKINKVDKNKIVSNKCNSIRKVEIKYLKFWLNIEICLNLNLKICLNIKTLLKYNCYYYREI